jgi:short-subunit dehydrogenase
MGQTFFLTGCASGMGRHLTDVFQKRGDRVFATDINAEALETASRELGWPEDRVICRALDVTKYDQWEACFSEAVEAFGGIDVTINFAGLLLSSWVHETPLKEIDSQVDVNIKGVIYGTRVSAAHMLGRGSGHILNVASIAGLIPVPGLAVYSATKYAVRAYSLSAALEMRSKGVYVTAFCPATVQTPMLDNQVDVDAAEMFFSGLRILTLEDIERAILRALRKKPYEMYIPWFKLRFFHIFENFPALSPLVEPFYRWSGRRRMLSRRKK